ncbi:hypothetical protein ACOSQ3_032672 [Xanthoceras sorbifolium]
MYSWYEAYDPIEEVVTNDYQWSYERVTPERLVGTPLGCFLCRGPHVSIDCQVGNPFADGSYKQINYVQNYNYQHNNPYPSIYNPRWSNRADFLWSNQQEEKSSVEDLISAFMLKQDAIMSNMDTRMDVQESSLKQLGQAITLEIKKLVEHPMGIDQVEMEVSKNVSHGDKVATSQEPPDSFFVHAIEKDDSQKVADDALWLDSSLPFSYESTFYFKELGEGKLKPPPPFEQLPHLGHKKLLSYLMYALLRELSSLPVTWLGWYGSLMRRY